MSASTLDVGLPVRPGLAAPCLHTGPAPPCPVRASHPPACPPSDTCLTPLCNTCMIPSHIRLTSPCARDVIQAWAGTQERSPHRKPLENYIKAEGARFPPCGR